MVLEGRVFDNAVVAMFVEARHCCFQRNVRGGECVHCAGEASYPPRLSINEHISTWCPSPGAFVYFIPPIFLVAPRGMISASCFYLLPNKTLDNAAFTVELRSMYRSMQTHPCVCTTLQVELATLLGRQPHCGSVVLVFSLSRKEKQA